MKAGWEVRPLGEVCERITDGSHNPSKGIECSEFLMLSSKNVWDDKIILDKPRYLSKKSFEDENKRTDVDAGDVLLTIVGTIGRSAVVSPKDGKFTLQRSVAVFKPIKATICSRFLMYALQSSLERLVDGAQGAAQKGIYLKSLRTFGIPIPPLEEQKRIVAVLDAAFEGLTRATDHAKANLQNARELFESHLSEVFSGSHSGWTRCEVGHVLTLQRGFDITKKDQREGTVPVVSSGGVKSFHDEVRCHAPGVVIGRKGSIGTVHYIEEDYWPHDTTLWVKDFKGNDPRLIAYLLRGLRLNELDSGAANPSLNRNIVHPVAVFWPKELDQKAISCRLDEIADECRLAETNYHSKLSDIADLRQSLLQKAFAGELT